MFDYLKGSFTQCQPTHVIVECNGIGYHVHISLNTYGKIKDLKSGTIYIHFQVKEDSQSFFGFYDESERSLFRNLVSVSGVGAGTARMILSSIAPEEIVSIITNGDAPTLQRVKGIGAKTAQRIVIDLKDKLKKGESEAKINIPSYNTASNEALTALITLGFARNTAQRAIEKAIKSSGSEQKVEDLIKVSLQHL
ncbi:MAG: Holliday junction branch migration protein RuvA [Bacteroidia bacterium]|nr:Holliday junction branch migration protein RuvA [Bacteroidia bacterium]NNC86761.1 Holliday junction branch migration protein RuvA [Bacteroidia bacterium]NNM16596.1 Holliday junction branch migration protein RuvA [Bacteroidia bacterium]